MPQYKIIKTVYHKGKPKSSGVIEIAKSSGDNLVSKGYLEAVKELKSSKNTKELKGTKETKQA